MRGGFLHNVVLVGFVEALLLNLGATVERESPVAVSTGLGFVDLLARIGSLRIVCEVEMTPRRVPRDIEKAIALRADLLLIVVPDAQVARLTRRRVRNHPRNIPPSLRIVVSTLGAVKTRLTHFLSIDDRADSRSDIKTTEAEPITPETSSGERRRPS